jgi:hypothetical protein
MDEAVAGDLLFHASGLGDGACDCGMASHLGGAGAWPIRP